MLKSRFAKVVAGITSALVVLLEVPSVGRLLARLFAIITGFDFFYERSKDPSWVGKATDAALNPPPGTALLVAIIGIALIYWTTKPREIRMSPPVIGMLISVISLAGFGVWYLATSRPDNAKQPTVDVPSNDTATHLSLKFGSNSTQPIATSLTNIWRWYALANVVGIVTPDGRKEIKTWTVYVTFDKPINVAQVIVSASAPLPDHEVKDRDSRSIIVAFMGDLKDIELELKVQAGIPSQVPKSVSPQVVTTTTPSPTTPVTTPPPPPPPQRPLSVYEAELKVKAIDKAIRILTDDMQPIVERFPLQQGWWNALKDPKNHPNFREGLLQFRDDYKASCLKLDTFRNSVPEYQDLVAMIAQPNYEKVLKAMEKYLTQFMFVQDTAKPDASKEALQAFMDDQMTEQYNAMNEFIRWRNQTRESVIALRRQISP